MVSKSRKILNNVLTILFWLVPCITNTCWAYEIEYDYRSGKSDAFMVRPLILMNYLPSYVGKVRSFNFLGFVYVLEETQACRLADVKDKIKLPKHLR